MSQDRQSDPMFKDKVLMITGGTGSFGNAVLSRFLDSDLGEIRIFSRDEQKQEAMRVALKSEKVRYYIGDVRDYFSVASAVRGADMRVLVGASTKVSQNRLLGGNCNAKAQ